MIRKRAGFSLIELVTVLAVLSVVSTIGFSAYFGVTGHWRETVLRENLRKQADQIFDMMQHDFDQVLSAALSGVAIRGLDQLEEERKYKLVPLKNDQLVLPIEYINPLKQQLVRADVMFHIDRREMPPLLRRTSGAYGVSLPEGASEILARGVLAMDLRFFDGEQWHASWAETRHPELVSVSLVLQDADRPYEQVAARRVFTVRVE